MTEVEGVEVTERQFGGTEATTLFSMGNRPGGLQGSPPKQMTDIMVRTRDGQDALWVVQEPGPNGSGEAGRGTEGCQDPVSQLTPRSTLPSAAPAPAFHFACSRSLDPNGGAEVSAPVSSGPPVSDDCSETGGQDLRSE